MDEYLYRLFAVLAPEQVETALQELSGLSGASNYQAVLAVSNPAAFDRLQNALTFQDLLLQGTSEASIGWEEKKIPLALLEQLNYSLLNGAAILILEGLTQTYLAQLSGVLEKFLATTPPSVLYDEYAGNVAFAMRIINDEVEKLDSGGGRPILHTAFSPDGHFILTTVKDGSAKLWEVKSGLERFSFWNQGGLSDALISPDGLHIATYHRFGSLHLWNMLDASEATRLQGLGEGRLESVYFSPDSRFLAAIRLVDSTQVISVWELASGQKHLEVPGSTYTFRSGNSAQIATALTNGPVQIWSLASKQLLFSLSGCNPLYSPMGSLLLNANLDVGVTLWDGSIRAKLYTSPVLEGWLTTATFSADERYLVTVDSQDLVLCWDLEQSKPLLKVSGSSKAILSPQSSYLATCASDNRSGAETVTIWDLKSGQAILRTRGFYPQFSPDETMLLVVTEASTAHRGSLVPFEGTTEVWSLLTKRLQYRLPGDNAVYTPDAHRLATPLKDGQTLLWKASSGQKLAEFGNVRTLLRLPGKGPSFGAAPSVTPIPPPERVQRYAEANYPETVALEEEFTVSTGLVVRPSVATPDAVALSLKSTVDPDRRTTGAPPVRVVLRAEAFEPSSQFADIQVNAAKQSEWVSFQLKSKADAQGLNSLNFRYFQGSDVLGEIVALIEINSGAVPANTARKNLVLRPTPRLRGGQVVSQPDVILHVMRERYQGGDVIHYAYEWLQQGWPLQEAGKIVLQTSVEQWVQSYYSALGQLAYPSVPGGAGKLEKIGQNLYRDLFTSKLKEGLKLFGSTARSMLIYSNEPWIPWEAVKPWGRDLDDSLKDFLSSRFRCSRWYISDAGRRPAASLELHELMTIIPILNLKAAQLEVNYLKSLHWHKLVVKSVSPRRAAEVLAYISAGSVELFHFATHGKIATIMLGQDSLQVDDLIGDQVVKGLSQSTPLIFMNACHSSRQTQGIRQLEGWADRFIEFGCSAFLGANWEINDELAGEFARNFYSALLAEHPLPLAQAVQDAKLKVRALDPNNSTWLAYSLFGHPNLRVLASDSPRA